MLAGWSFLSRCLDSADSKDILVPVGKRSNKDMTSADIKAVTVVLLCLLLHILERLFLNVYS